MQGRFLVFCCALVIGACENLSVGGRKDNARGLAETAGFTYAEIETKSFTLAAYGRFGLSKNVTIYLEGDGFAYVTPTKISSNPTPIKPTALTLATSDSSESVIYLARPCQYVDLTREKYCSHKYWSSHRFAEEVVSAYEQALDQIKNLVQGVAFHLVGYSGGGAVAVLIASRRGDVISVRTVAGYLDHIALNEMVGAAPLKGSLDPMRAASALRGIPQVHYSGLNDLVIPPWVGERFVSVVGNPKCARWIRVDGVSHEYGWVEYWKTVEHIKPTC